MKIYKLQRTLVMSAGSFTYTVGDYTDEDLANKDCLMNNQSLKMFSETAQVTFEGGGSAPLSSFMSGLGLQEVRHDVIEAETVSAIDLLETDIVRAH